MDERLHEYKPSRERDLIMEALLLVRQKAEEAAELLKRQGYRDDAHKVSNIAQAASTRRCLMAQTFAVEDGRDVRTGAAEGPGEA